MKLFVESHLPVDPAAAWAIFESEAYRDRLAERARIQQEILEQREEGGLVITRVRTVPERELPRMVANLVGASKLSYVQENRFDAARSRLDWTVRLDVMADKVDVAGRTTLEPAPGGGTRRVVDGDIRVRVPLVGGQIEKAVVAEFEKSMQRAVEVALELIEERPLA